MKRPSTRNRITYHQLPATTTTSIYDSFESTQSHVNEQDDWDNLIMVYESTVNTEKFKNQKPLQQKQQLYWPFRVQTKQTVSSLKLIPSFKIGHWIRPPTRLQIHQSTTHCDEPWKQWVSTAAWINHPEERPCSFELQNSLFIR